MLPLDASCLLAYDPILSPACIFESCSVLWHQQTDFHWQADFSFDSGNRSLSDSVANGGFDNASDPGVRSIQGIGFQRLLSVCDDHSARRHYITRFDRVRQGLFPFHPKDSK